MSDLVQATVEYRFARASAEEVFDAWLTPEDVRLWMADALSTHGLSGAISRIEIDARVGGRFLFSDMRNGEEAIHWGTYLKLERPALIEFTWFTSQEEETEGTSIVRIEITPKDSGCAVRLTHSMNAKYADYLKPTERGWSTMLAAIQKRCER